MSAWACPCGAADVFGCACDDEAPATKPAPVAYFRHDAAGALAAALEAGELNEALLSMLEREARRDVWRDAEAHASTMPAGAP